VVWEAIFLLVILKIPIVYLCAVVYWAIKAEPRPEEGAALLPVAVEPDPRPEWSRARGFRRPRRRGPRGGPARSYARGRVPAFVRAEAER
jgi:hypothetical protein